MKRTPRRITALFLVLATLWGIVACSNDGPWRPEIENYDEQQSQTDSNDKDNEHETSVSDNINSNTPAKTESTSNTNADNNETPEFDNEYNDEFEQYKNLSPKDVYRSLLEAENVTITLVQSGTQFDNADEITVIIGRDGDIVSESYASDTGYHDMGYYNLENSKAYYEYDGKWNVCESLYNWEMLVNSVDTLPTILGSCFAEGNYTQADNQFNLTQEGIADINYKYGNDFEQICSGDYGIEAYMKNVGISYAYYFKIYNLYEDISMVFDITVDFNGVTIDLPEVDVTQDDVNDNDTNTEDAPDENVTKIVNIIMDNIDQWETVSDEFTRKYTYDDVEATGISLYNAGQQGEYYLGITYTIIYNRSGTSYLSLAYHRIFYVTENEFRYEYGDEVSMNDRTIKYQHFFGTQYFSYFDNKRDCVVELIESCLENEKAYFDEINLYPDETIELSNEEYSLYYNMHSAIQELEYYEPRSSGSDVLLPLVRIAYYDLGDGKCEALLYYGSIIGNSFSGYVVGYAINEEGYSKLSNEGQERLENTSKTVKLNWNVEWTVEKEQYMLQKSITER